MIYRGIGILLITIGRLQASDRAGFKGKQENQRNKAKWRILDD